MFKRRRSTSMAGAGALLLIVALSGVVAGATLVSDALPTDAEVAPPQADTTLTWEDTDGNGVDDDCQAADPDADPEAAAAADDAVDLDGDDVISVSEAAKSGRIGGKNCNHGGYVSTVAHGDDVADADEDDEADDEATESAAECETPPDPEPVVEPVEETVVAPNAHGKAVSKVAKSDEVGGKNCNHGGAVSEVAKEKADKAAAKAERDAAKAERKAARDAAKAQRKAAHDAAKAAKHHGKPGG
ncbi:MAG: hypothetical protein ACXW4T_01790 [Candidatus Limnocylindrales bacterium]